MTAGRAAMAKKNKKKQKAKAAQVNNHSNNIANSRLEDEDEDDVQVSSNGPNHAYANTGLSPELESVHLSTTASLNPKNPNNNINPDLNQLMATAQQLYHSASFRETDIGSFPSAEEYWQNLPDKVQNLIRQASNNLTGSPAERQEALMAIMTSMAKGGRIPGGFPMPDAQALLGLDLSQGQAELAAKFNVSTGMYRQEVEYTATFTTNGVEEDEYGTEDEDYYNDDQDGSQGHGAAGGRRRAKKKKKRAVVDTPVSIKNFIWLIQLTLVDLQPLPPQQVAPPPQHPQPPPQLARARQTPQPQPMPQQPVAARPPPSSRAAGKQPMSYPASTNQPPRSQTQSTTNTNSSVKSAVRGKTGYASAHRGTPAKPNAQAVPPKNKIW